MLAGRVPLLANVILLMADVVLELSPSSRGCCSSTKCGFPGIYGNPRFLAPTDGPTTVVVATTMKSSVVVTVLVTVGVVIIVILNEGTSSVEVEVRVTGFVVVSLVGLVVTRVVTETFETIVAVNWGGTEYPRTSVHHMVSLFSCIMELASATGLWNTSAAPELDTSVELGLSTVIALEVVEGVVDVLKLTGKEEMA